MSEKKISDKVFDIKLADYNSKKAEWDDQILVRDIDTKRDSTIYETHKHKEDEDRSRTQHSVQEFWYEARPEEPIKPHRRPFPGDEVKVNVRPDDTEKGSTLAPKTAIAGETINIEAIPRPHYMFVCWSDENTEELREIYVVDDIDLIAYFELIPAKAFYFSPIGTGSAQVMPTGLKNPDYSYDGYEWTAYVGGYVGVGNGEKLYWRSNGKTDPDTPGFKIIGDNVLAGGNVFSLASKTDFESVTTVKEKMFKNLFKDLDLLMDIQLVNFPATSIDTDGCSGMFENSAIRSVPYNFMNDVVVVSDRACEGMFRNCDHLLQIAETILPSELLGIACYREMFKDCSNLISIPEGLLPSKRLKDSCYESMFEGCSRITKSYDLSEVMTIGYRSCARMYANSGVVTIEGVLPHTARQSSQEMYLNCENLLAIPEGMLPEEELDESCYRSMFQGCKNLTSVPSNLFVATLVPEYAYQSMFQDCESLVTPSELTAVTCKISSFESMYEGCKSLTSIPKIEVVSVPDNAMRRMFFGCESLESVDISGVKVLYEHSLEGMFQNCIGLKNITMDFLTVGDTSCQYMMKDCKELDHIVCKFVYPENFSKLTFLEWTWQVKNCFLPEGGYFYEAPDSFWPRGSANGNPWSLLEDYECPLSFFADDEFSITLEAESSYPNKIEYTFNLYQWNTYTPGTKITVPRDKRVYFRRTLIIPGSETSFVHFVTEVPVYVRGNLMSMVISEDFKDKDDNAIPYSHYKMFQNFQFLDSAHLVTSATSLSEGCYSSMFSGSNIHNLGEVLKPEAVLAPSCYRYMFRGCENLPTDMEFLELNTENVPSMAYLGMFRETNIEKSPTINCLDIDNDYACSEMFAFCSSLNKITIPLFDYDSEKYIGHTFNGTGGWVRGVAEEGEFICNPDSMWPPSDSGNPWIKYENIYFWVENPSEGAIAHFQIDHVYSYSNKTIYYSFDGTHWDDYNFGTFSFGLLPKMRIYFKSNDRANRYFGRFYTREGNLKVGGFMAAMYIGDDYLDSTYEVANGEGIGGLFQNTLVSDMGELDLFFHLDWRRCPYAFSNLCSNVSSLTVLPRLFDGYTVEGMYSNAFENCKGISSIQGMFDNIGERAEESCFYCMFKGCSNLVQGADLPATYVGTSAYEQMFYQCNRLLYAGDISAETLQLPGSKHMYQMFSYCTSLIKVPAELKAATLGTNSYAYMFYGCTNIESAPIIYASVVANYSMYVMFYSCTKLRNTQDTFYFTDIRDQRGTCQGMYRYCQMLSRPPKLPIKKLTPDGAGIIGDSPLKYTFANTSVTVVYLDGGGYDISGWADYVLNFWLEGCPGNGVVHTSSSTKFKKGTSGVPETWRTIRDYNP